MEIHYESDTSVISFSKDKKLVKLEWRRNATPDEYRETFRNALELTKKYKLLFFISDIRKQGAVQIEEVKWLHYEIIQVAINSDLRKIAVILDDNFYSQIYYDAVKSKIRGTSIEMENFNSEDSALEWIRSDDF